MAPGPVLPLVKMYLYNVAGNLIGGIFNSREKKLPTYHNDYLVTDKLIMLNRVHFTMGGNQTQLQSDRYRKPGYTIVDLIYLAANYPCIEATYSSLRYRLLYIHDKNKIYKTKTAFGPTNGWKVVIIDAVNKIIY